MKLNAAPTEVFTLAQEASEPALPVEAPALRKFLAKQPFNPFADLEQALSWESLNPHREIVPLLRYLFAERPGWLFNRGVSEEAFAAAQEHFLNGTFHVDVAERLQIESYESAARCRLFAHQVIPSLTDLSAPLQQNPPSRTQVYESLQILRYRNLEAEHAQWFTNFESWLSSKGVSPAPQQVSIDLYERSAQSVYFLSKLKLPFSRMAQGTGEDYFPRGSITPHRDASGVFLLDFRDPKNMLVNRWVVADSEGNLLTHDRELFCRARGAAGNFTMALLGQGPFALNQAWTDRQVERPTEKEKHKTRCYVSLFADCADWKRADQFVGVPWSYEIGKKISPRFDLSALRAGKHASMFWLQDPDSAEHVCTFDVLGYSDSELSISPPHYCGRYASWELVGARQRAAVQAHRWLESVPGIEMPILGDVAVHGAAANTETGDHRGERWVTFLTVKAMIDNFEGAHLRSHCVFDQKSGRRFIGFWPPEVVDVSAALPLAAIYAENPQKPPAITRYLNGRVRVSSKIRVFPRDQFSSIQWEVGSKAPLHDGQIES